jgi:zinc D-Ala-D-Ala dipeptidase
LETLAPACACRSLPPVRYALLLTLALLACARAPVAQTANTLPVETGELPHGTAAQFDSLMVDVQSLASGIRVDMRYRGAGNFTGAPLPGYDANRAFLRREAAQALARVQARLEREGATLLVWDAYRPVRATLAMVDWTRRVGREDLVRDGYIAARSRHNLGVAIDLTLADAATGEPLPMGTAFDTFSTAAHTDSATGPAMANRDRLRRAMEAEGWRNYAQEWWHFSFAVERPLRFDVPVR